MAISEKVAKALRVPEHFGIRSGLMLGWRVLRGKPSILTVHDPSGLTYQTRNDRSQASHLPVSTQKILAMAERIERCETVLDIGGNVGLFSLAVRLRFPNARIVCVEADPELAEIAKANLGSDPSVTVLARAAVEDERPEVSLFIAQQSNQVGSLYREAVEPFARATEISSIRVPAVAVGDLFALFPTGCVDVMKVDIQGYEHQLFASNRHLLERVAVCFLEASFLDPNVHRLLDLFHASFPRCEVVNHVVAGADLMFSR